MNTEEGQIDIPDERMPNDSEIMPMETSDTHLETRTVATPPQTTSEPSVSQVTDVTMEDIEPGTTTPARTPENAVTVEEQGLEEAQEGHEEMEVSISCTQEDSRPESEAILEEIKTEESKSEVKNISVEMADSSSTVTPGNLRNEWDIFPGDFSKIFLSYETALSIMCDFVFIRRKIGRRTT